MQLTAPSPLLLNKGQPSSPCYCHTACHLQGSQMGSRLCPAPGQHPRGTSQPHRQAAGTHRHTGSWAERMAVLRGCARTLGTFFPQGMNSGKGQGLLCTGGKAAAPSVQLPAGDTLGDWRIPCSCSLVSSRSSRDSDTRSSLFHTSRPQLFRKSNVLHSIMSRFYL